MSYVDALFDRDSDIVRVVERKDGKRKFTEYPIKYTFYYEDQKGKFKSIYGDPISRIVCKNTKEFRKELAINKGKKMFESDINPIFQCLSENYLNQDAPKLNIAFFDIETDFDPERGFADPSDPFMPITSISVYLQWMETMICIAVPPKTLTMEQAKKEIEGIDNVMLVEKESEMIDTFLTLIEDADILSGWNSEGYDIPYTVNRTARVLSKDDTRRFCLWGQLPKKREYEKYGKQAVTFDLIGRVHLDSLELYRKYTYEERHTYRLDAIGEVEVGENKVPYEGTLDQLYNNDFRKFIEYNIQDTALLDKLDKKLRFIDLSNELAHANTVLLQTTMGAVAVTEQAIVNEAHRRGMQVPNRPHRDEENTQAAGAYVAFPKKGLHKWIASMDLNSLYPSVIRALNMDPATVVGQLRPDLTNAMVEDAMTLQKKSFAGAWEQAFWDKRQLVKKINLNSLYGAILNPGCRFFDPRIGQSTTLTGRAIAKHMSAEVNKVITGKYDHVGDSIIYGDTDSVYFSAHPVLKEDIDKGSIPWGKENVLKLYDQICEEANETFPKFMQEAFHCPKTRSDVIAAGREIVAESGLFITKKRYAALIYDNEGERMDVDGKLGKVKAMGLDLKRSDTPVFMQEFLSELLLMVLTDKTETEILEKITDFRTAFKLRPGFEKGSPKRANKIGEYQRKEAKMGKATMPGHVRASINWNTLKRMNGDKYSQEIVDGMKVIVCKLKQNPLGYTSVAYPTDELRIPDWFKELPFDDDAMESTIIDNKLDNLIGVLNYDISSTLQNNTFSSLFDFGE